MFGGGSAIRLPAKNPTIDDFIDVMQRNMVDRPIVDRTGLTGKFDFTVTFTPNDYQVAMMGGGLPPPGENPPPDPYTAIQQQLGLKLEPAKAAVEVMVVDRLEKPSAN